MDEGLYETKNPSIYRQLLEAADQQGRLPPLFSPFVGTGGIRPVPGALDGIRVFHYVKPVVTQEVKQLGTLLQMVCQGETPENMGRLLMFLNEHLVLYLIDALLGQIQSHELEISARNLYDVGICLMTETDLPEAVKLGISLIGILNIQRDAVCREILMTLGKCEEFTLYVLVVVAGWPYGNREIFRLAQETRGWGKIHAVERLAPDTEEIRQWMLCKGCENEISEGYLGLTCAEGARLMEQLARPRLDSEEFHGIGKILLGMLDEQLVPGISAWEDGTQLLEAYLAREEHGETLENLMVVLKIRERLENAELDPEDNCLSMRCEEIIEDPLWVPMVYETLENGEGDALQYACEAAEVLMIDMADLVLARMEKEPLEWAYLAPHICKTPQMVYKLCNLYQEQLPCREMSRVTDAAGLGAYFHAFSALEWVLQGLGQFQGFGIGLIKTALASAVIRTRNMALNILESWGMRGKRIERMDTDLLRQLKALRHSQKGTDLGDRIAAILDTVP